ALLVTHDSSAHELLGAALKSVGLRVTVAADASEAFAALKAEAPDLILLDMDLPDAGALDVFYVARDRAKLAPVALLCAADTPKGNLALFSPDELLTKPVRTPELFAVIERALPKPGEATKPLQMTPPGSATSASPGGGSGDTDQYRRVPSEDALDQTHPYFGGAAGGFEQTEPFLQRFTDDE
ncbi:MAG: response regulator, partial [Myxococcales bacterium]|nr:response regulator [Myxococcales bacterium]